MTAINLPGQLEVPLGVDHKDAGMNRQQNPNPWGNAVPQSSSYAVQIAKLLRSYEERPTSETWSRIQALAKEILK